MTLIGEPLFTERNAQTLDDFLRFKGSTIEEAAEHIGELRFKNETEDDIALTIVNAFIVRPLTLKLTEAVTTVNETNVEAIARFDKTENAPKTFGYHMAKAIPYAGAPELWKYRPAGELEIFPRGTITNAALTVGTKVPEDEVEQGKEEMRDLIALIQTIIDQQTVQIEAYNTGLPAIVKPMVKRRRERYRRLIEIRESF